MSFKKKSNLKVIKKSAGHILVRNMLASAYPAFRRLEEEAVMAMVDGRFTKLFIDFLLPDFKVAIEVHGRQHIEYVGHFHGSSEGFASQRRRDIAKAEAINNAGYSLVVIHESSLSTLTRTALMKTIHAAQERSE